MEQDAGIVSDTDANLNQGVRPFRDVQPSIKRADSKPTNFDKVELTEQVIRAKVKKSFKTRIQIGTKNENKARTRKDRHLKDNIRSSMF